MRTTRDFRRRGATAVMVMVMVVTLLGFAALTIDVGAMYNAKADLQRCADAAALAAAAQLGDYSTGDPASMAAAAAEDMVGRNAVLGHAVQIGVGDVVFGRADYLEDPPTGQRAFSFVPGGDIPDAVRVRVRMTRDSPNGRFGLFFAPILGHTGADISAQATAVMIPRDIAIVADLSSSHTDDSEFCNYHLTEIGMWDTWSGLPGGYGDVDSSWADADIRPEWVLPDGSVPQAAGPAWGYMKQMGFGALVIPKDDYSPAADAGLVQLAYGDSWSNVQLTAYLAVRGYSSTERDAIMTNFGSDSSTVYPLRVAVALGLAEWNSGLSGGRWSTVGAPAGNNNASIGASEVQWTQSIMGRSASSSATIFKAYVAFMRSTSSTMYAANSDLRYRFGAKTFVNFLLSERERHSLTPELSNAPHYPMQAVKDSVTVLAAYLDELESNDKVSLETYATTVHHEIDLTSDFGAVSDRLNAMHGGYYDNSTNTGGGIRAAIDELAGPRARTMSSKVIILMTDGIANVGGEGLGGPEYARHVAEEAADRGIRIFTVSVGAAADTELMQDIADIGHGEHFRASGTIGEYSAALRRIFVTIGGRRPVALAE